jgi:GNAT superfamily N-acetyltransferase
VPSARLATRSDVSPLAVVLARAFVDDPIYLWTFGKGNARWSRRFFKWQLGRLVGFDATWTIDDGAGAAAWAPPGDWRESPAALLRLTFMTLPGIGRRLRRVVTGLNRIDELHPTADHYYLAVLGVDPPRQGTGLGSGLMQPGLQRCDEQRMPAFLETSKERNIAFYNHHGFEVTDRVDLPEGPPVWLMWRRPQ